MGWLTRVAHGSQAEHPFITRLVCTYADPSHVYFLLAPALGGEVLHALSLLGNAEVDR